MFSLARFDLLFVICALVFNLTVIGVYVSAGLKRMDLSRVFGTGTLVLTFPLIAIFIDYINIGKPLLTLLMFGAIFLYMAVELLLDFIFKIEFRKITARHIPYIFLFYLAEFCFLFITYSISTICGWIVSASFWLLLAGLIFSLIAGRGKARVKS
jgi:hypothetical protein